MSPGDRADRPSGRGARPLGRLVLPVLLAAAVVALASACEDDPFGSSLSVQLVGPGTGVVGEELTVRYDARGRSLVGVILAWGDGAVDSISTSGAQTAAGTRRHTYQMPGLFTVQARVEDALEGAKTAEVSIQVGLAGQSG